MLAAVKTWIEAHALGVGTAGLVALLVGGGLGVDYDGSQTNFESSINYTLQEYARDVIARVQTVCDEVKVKHPTIVTEAGRAMVSHHSLLVTRNNVIVGVLRSTDLFNALYDMMESCDCF